MSDNRTKTLIDFFFFFCDSFFFFFFFPAIFSVFHFRKVADTPTTFSFPGELQSAEAFLLTGKGDPSKHLFVSGIEDSVTEAILSSAFAPFGTVVSVRIPFENDADERKRNADGNARNDRNAKNADPSGNPNTNPGALKRKGFGFVEMDNTEDAKDAVMNLDGFELFGRIINVRFSDRKEAEVPERKSTNRAIWHEDTTEK
jgi:hypothetical protein